MHHARVALLLCLIDVDSTRAFFPLCDLCGKKIAMRTARTDGLTFHYLYCTVRASSVFNGSKRFAALKLETLLSSTVNSTKLEDTNHIIHSFIHHVFFFFICSFFPFTTTFYESHHQHTLRLRPSVSGRFGIPRRRTRRAIVDRLARWTTFSWSK
jgi:hypothetical protein